MLCILQRHHHSKRQLFAAWRLVCHQANLLRIAQDRLRRRTLAATFMSWRHLAFIKNRRRSLLQVRARGSHVGSCHVGRCSPVG